MILYPLFKKVMQIFKKTHNPPNNMSLSIIGIGLYDEKDITIRGLELVKEADIVYLETYTSTLSCPLPNLERLYGKKILPANRNLIEQEQACEQAIISPARTQKVALLIVGDPLCATTHTDLLQRCRQAGIDVTIVSNSSILTAIGIIGLSLYKFGKTASIPFHANNSPIDTPLQTLIQNTSQASHTLVLLDLDPPTQRYLTIAEAISQLTGSAKRMGTPIFSPSTLCIGCSKLGSPDPIIKAGAACQLQKEDFGQPPYCLIIPGPLHFMEQEALDQYNIPIQHK